MLVDIYIYIYMCVCVCVCVYSTIYTHQLHRALNNTEVKEKLQYFLKITSSLEAFFSWLSVGLCRWIQRASLKSSNDHCLALSIIRQLLRMICDKMVDLLKIKKGGRQV